MAAALFGAWLLFVIALALLRPRHLNFRETMKIVPDVIRLIRALAGDAALPKSVRRRLGLLLAYLALPFDLVPDFIPVLGYADDVIVTALVLRSVVRRAGATTLERHWQGSADGLALVRRLAGVEATS